MPQTPCLSHPSQQALPPVHESRSLMLVLHGVSNTPWPNQNRQLPSPPIGDTKSQPPSPPAQPLPAPWGTAPPSMNGPSATWQLMGGGYRLGSTQWPHKATVQPPHPHPKSSPKTLKHQVWASVPGKTHPAQMPLRKYLEA